MNKSGIKPMEYKVLVEPVKVEEKTAGGIYLPDQVKDKNKFANDEGTIIAVGPIAFTDPHWLECPKVGDKVMFDRYAGILVKGKDENEYRIINDKEICAILEEV
jgi:chaperonin GroES